MTRPAGVPDSAVRPDGAPGPVEPEPPAADGGPAGEDAGDTAPTTHPSTATTPVWRRTLDAVVPAWPHLTAAVLALAAALWTYRPWRFGSALMTPSGDALAFAAWVQNIVETGWYETGTRLAAPFAQNNHSYTVTDELLFAWVGKVLVPITGSVGAAITWSVVLSFPLAAVLAVVAARTLRISRLSAVLVGTAFAVLPDHFLRGSGHFSLAQTWVIPIGVMAATSLVHPWEGSRRRRVVTTSALLVGCASISLVNAYYAVFTGLVVVGAGLGAWRRFGPRFAIVGTALRGAALAVPLAFAMWLDKLYTPSPLGFPSIEISRSPADADVYGGKLVAMLLPAAAHRVQEMRSLRAVYDTTFPNPAEGPSLGLVASVAFVALMVWALLAYWGPASLRRVPVAATLAALTWVAILCYTVGGIGELWAFLLGGGGLRAWSRMHVVIALLALLAAGVWLDRLRRRGLRVALTVVLVAVALVDQTSPFYRPDPVHAVAMQDEVSDLTARAGRLLPDHAAVYQFPDVTFALALRNTAPASAYDGFLPYMYSAGDLRWSYGGLQGDPRSDWQTSLGTRPMTEQVPLLRAAGFEAVLVDTLALTSDPDSLADARATLGEPVVTSASGRWELYRLPALDASCQAGSDDLRDAALKPPLLYPGEGTHPFGNVIIADKAGVAELRLVTLRDGGWPHVDLTFTVDAPSTGLRLTWPDGTSRTLEPGAQELHWSGALPATEQVVRLERLGPGAESFNIHTFTADVGLSDAAEQCLTVAGAEAAAD